MTTNQNDEDLRHVFDNPPIDLTKPHRLQTSDCPSIYRLAVVPQSRWTRDERRHALLEQCEYCQFVIASTLSEECPSRSELVRYAVSPAASPIQGALERHIKQDGCVNCHKTLQSLGWLVSMLQRSDRLVAHLSATMARLSDFGVLEPSFTAGFDSGLSVPHAQRELKVELMDSELEVYTTIDDGALRITAKSRNPSLSGRTVNVELVGATGSTAVELVLKPVGPQLVSASTLVGSAQQLYSELGEYVIAVNLDLA